MPSTATHGGEFQPNSSIGSPNDPVRGMDYQKPPSRRGVETIRRYGADYIAARARYGLVLRRLREDGLDPDRMKPADLAAYERRVFREHADMMRAARAAKRAARAAATQAKNGDAA